MKNFLTLLLCLSTVTAQAGEIWVVTPELTGREKLQKIVEDRRSLHKESDFISSFDAYLARPVNADVQADLLKAEENAQAAELNGKFEKALSLYKQLGRKLENVPNVSGIEHMSFAVWLHIAELEDLTRSREASASWRQAHAWNPRPLSADSEFSPEIIRKFNALAIDRIKATLDIITPAEAWVYVDDRRVHENNGRFRELVEPGYHQAAILTPGSEWMFKNVTVIDGETKDVSFRPEPIIEGDCDSPRYIGSALPAKTKLMVAFTPSCDRVYYDKAWFSIAGRRIEGLTPSLAPSRATSGALMNQLLTQSEEKSWWEKTSRSGWFWTGVGVVVVGAIALAVQSQNQQTVVVPTQTVR